MCNRGVSFLTVALVTSLLCASATLLDLNSRSPSPEAMVLPVELGCQSNNASETQERAHIKTFSSWGDSSLNMIWYTWSTKGSFPVILETQYYLEKLERSNTSSSGERLYTMFNQFRVPKPSLPARNYYADVKATELLSLAASVLVETWLDASLP